MASTTRNVECRHIIITNNSCNESVTVTQEIVNVDVRSSVGRRGPQGPEGPPSDQATKLYLDVNVEDTTLYFPFTTVPTSDTFYDFKVPSRTVLYQQNTTLPVGNPLRDTVTNIDEITIGGGSDSAGAIFLNSTVNRPTILYSDEPLYIQSYDELYLTASSIQALTNIEGTSSYALTASKVDLVDEDQFVGTSFKIALTSGTATGEANLINPVDGGAYRGFSFIQGTNPINGDDSFEIRGGGNAHSAGIQFNNGPEIPAYVKTFNSDLYLFPKKELHLTGSKIIIDDLPTSDPGQSGQLYTTGSEFFGAPAGLKVLMIS